MSAEPIKEMMDNWNKVHAAVRAAMPNASEEQVYQMTAEAMTKSLAA